MVVTGLGPLLPNCDHRDAFWRHVSQGESQLTLEPHPILEGEQCPMGRIHDFDPSKYLSELPERFYLRYHRELQIYLASLFLARNDAGLDVRAVPSERIGLFDGSSRPTFQLWYELIKREGAAKAADIYTRRELVTGMAGGTVGVAASLLKICGPAYAFSGTCSSGAIAIGHAYREILSGEIDVAFATGHDLPLVPPVFAMYEDANLISLERQDARRAVRPFVDFSTNAFGEGAVTLVLESRAHAEARGARIFATIAGYRYGNNGYHPTTVDVAGLRPADILKRLVRETGIPLDDVGFVVGHGNAVHLSDISEENYMRLLFGARAAQVPLVSTKPIYGHTVGGSSAVNAAAAALMLHHEYVIPTINVDASRVKRNASHQPNTGVARACEAGISMSYGMGGHNAALLLRRYPGTRAATKEGR
ncbi:MAG TPA: beta-ketoacyl synthase N-terminal-like domain-containing protein [Polyangiaceae bacterium]